MLSRLKSRLYSILDAWDYNRKIRNHISANAVFTKAHNVLMESAYVSGNVNIKENSSIKATRLSGNIFIGSNVKLNDAFVNGTISIGDHSKVIDGVELHGTITIGRYTSINGKNTDLRAALNNITIGNFCSIARNVVFQEYNHKYDELTTYMVNTNMKGGSFNEDIVSNGAIELGHDVWIGTHCVILSGAKIGTGAVIAANSVVTGEIPPYAIAAGSPAKVIKYRFDEPTIKRLLESAWWNKTDEEILTMFREFKNANG